MPPPVFAHGALRLYLLALLETGPKHGYELIKALGDRFGGTYSPPSAGTIYRVWASWRRKDSLPRRPKGAAPNTSLPIPAVLSWTAAGRSWPPSRTPYRPPSGGWQTTCGRTSGQICVACGQILRQQRRLRAPAPLRLLFGAGRRATLPKASESSRKLNYWFNPSGTTSVSSYANTAPRSR